MHLHELKRELGLGPGASRKDVRSRFLELALKLHPDKTDKKDDAQKYMNIMHAYSELMTRMPPDRKQLPSPKKRKTKTVKVDVSRIYQYKSPWTTTTLDERLDIKRPSKSTKDTETDRHKQERTMKVLRGRILVVSIAAFAGYVLYKAIAG